MRRPPAILLLLILAGLFFAAWTHPRIVDPTRVGWVLDGEDRGQGAAGLAAFLRAPPPWPTTRQTLLSAPEGATLLLTDSNPLLGLALRPFADVLPGGLQFVGLWLLLCVVLQFAFAWALLRPWARDDMSALLGSALLAASPVLINRAGHPNLCAHWLLLWALWLFVDARRARRPGWWAAVMGVAALVHPYLLLMVAAIWASATLRALVREPDRWRLLAGAGAVAASTALILSVHELGGERFEPSMMFGRFAMAIDGWWNPFNTSFEGLQYLGAGVLLLVAVAVVAGARGRIDPDALRLLRRLAWLGPAFLVLGLLALGTEWTWAGRTVVDVPLPRPVLAALDPVRAAGRLFWPATYALAFIAILLVLRLERARFLLAGACAIQIANLAPFVLTMRAVTAAADDPRPYRRTVDPRWAGLVANAGSVAFRPADPFRDLALVQELQWRAIAACRPTNVTYLARRSPATRDRLAAADRDWRRGLVDPTTLHILFDEAPPWAATRVRTLGGVRYLPPSRPAEPPRCA